MARFPPALKIEILRPDPKASDFVDLGQDLETYILLKIPFHSVLL